MVKKIAIAVIGWIVEQVPRLPQRITEFVARLFPLQHTILFESQPAFTDNTRAVYEELLRRGLNRKYRFIWITHKDYTVELPENVSYLNLRASWFSNHIRGRWVIARAKFIIDCNGYVHKTNRRTIRVHLTHGLAIKSVPWYNHAIGDVDLICVSAPYWVPHIAKSYLVPQQIVQPLGFPRNDILLHPLPHERKTLVWMPTYRVHTGSVSSHAKRVALYRELMPFGLPCIRDTDALRELNDILISYNALLYIRLHPAQDVSSINLRDLSNIRICDNAYLEKEGIILYDLLRRTDALISDYSSIYYDYLLLDKPIAMVVSDFEAYSKNNGLLESSLAEFKQARPATYVESFEQLKQFFRDVLDGKDVDREQRKAGREKYMGAQTDHAAANVADYMQQHFGL